MIDLTNQLPNVNSADPYQKVSEIQAAISVHKLLDKTRKHC